MDDEWEVLTADFVAVVVISCGTEDKPDMKLNAGDWAMVDWVVGITKDSGKETVVDANENDKDDVDNDDTTGVVELEVAMTSVTDADNVEGIKVDDVATWIVLCSLLSCASAFTVASTVSELCDCRVDATDACKSLDESLDTTDMSPELYASLVDNECKKEEENREDTVGVQVLLVLLLTDAALFVTEVPDDAEGIVKENEKDGDWEGIW